MPASPIQLPGLTIAGVYWTPSSEKNYARYLVTTTDRNCFEVTVAGLRPCTLPTHANTSLQAEFHEIIGKTKIKEVRTDDQTDLYILLDSGHLMALGGTFNGVDTGNTFFMETPAEAAQWVDRYLKLRLVNSAESP